MFRDVWFSYDGLEVLKDFSMRVHPGEHVAVVGASGSGKTTIAALLLRLYEPRKGDVLVNGKSIREYSLKSLRRRVLYVPSKPFLFNASVRDNITLGEEFSEEELRRVLRVCRVDFIDDLDKSIGELGSALSEGQRQRIGLARALIRKPSVLILDEATSGVDAKTEAEILRELRKAYPDMTVIVMSHRLSTVMNADRIVVLHNGKAVAQGKHEELLRTCPEYFNLIKEQLVK